MKTSQEISKLNEKCSRLLEEEPELRFAGIINKLGHLDAGRFRDNIQHHILDERTRMLYMQMVLDFSMRTEFNDDLGPVKWSATRRGKVLMMTIPVEKDILLLSAETQCQTGDLYRKAKNVFTEL